MNVNKYVWKRNMQLRFYGIEWVPDVFVAPFVGVCHDVSSLFINWKMKLLCEI